MTDFTNNRPPAHVRMGDSEEDKYDNETMADEERQGRQRYKRGENDQNVMIREKMGTSPEAEEIHQYFSDTDDSKRPLMEKVRL